MSHTKQQLQALADRLLVEDREAITTCIDFIESKSEGVWHGRARAMMCRRLKHLELKNDESNRLVGTILERLRSGNFSEQFRDMLRLALRLDPVATLDLAESLTEDNRAYIRRQAEWIVGFYSAGDS